MTTPAGGRPVVTIFETYGSGAATVAPAVADALGVPYVAQHFSSEELEAADTELVRPDSFVQRILGTLGRGAATADAGVFSGPLLEREAAEGVRRLRAAVTDGGVVVGRNGTVVLADIPYALHVKLDGPIDQRIARAAAETGIELARARARQAREDAVRAEMSVRLHNWDPRHTDRFDLVINSGNLPFDVVVEMIVANYRIKAAAVQDT